MQSRPLFSPDRALSDPALDKLGYAPFAKALARSITEMNPPEGLVIGIYGQWGIGKTTVLGFVEHYLKESNLSPVVIPFNPWWFAGHEDLARKFIHQLKVNFAKAEIVDEKLGNFMGALGDLISVIPLEGANAVGKALGMARTPDKDFNELKERISKALRKQHRRILVVIDDIDRLSAEEVRHVFAVIKAVANFPNVTYLVAFDRGAVAAALDKYQSGKGEDFLEKIIQVSFEMPRPDTSAMEAMLLTKLDEIARGTPEVLISQEDWANVYYGGIQLLFRTPRDILRYLNTLQVTYPTVKGEVNAVDFFAIEAIRIFQPSLYDLIRTNPQFFISNHENIGDKGALQAFHLRWPQELSKDLKEPLVSVMRWLLPKSAAGAADVISPYKRTWSERWIAEARLADKDHFAIYFRFGLPAEAFSRAAIEELLRSAIDEDRFAGHLHRLLDRETPSGKTVAHLALSRLHGYIPELSSYAPQVIRVLLDIGDELDVDKDRGQALFESGNDMLILSLSKSLLGTMEPSARSDLLLSSAQHARAIGTLSHITFHLAAQHGKHGRQALADSQRLLSSAELTELEQVVALRISSQILSGELPLGSHFPMMLHLLSETIGLPETKSLVQEFVEDYRRLAYYFEAHLSITREGVAGTKFARIKAHVRPKDVEKYLGPTLRRDAKALLERPDLTAKQRHAVETYLSAIARQEHSESLE